MASFISILKKPKNKFASNVSTPNKKSFGEIIDDYNNRFGKRTSKAKTVIVTDVKTGKQYFQSNGKRQAIKNVNTTEKSFVDIITEPKIESAKRQSKQSFKGTIKKDSKLIGRIKSAPRDIGKGVKEVAIEVYDVGEGALKGSYNYGYKLSERANKQSKSVVSILGKDIKKLAGKTINIADYVYNNPKKSALIVGATATAVGGDIKKAFADNPTKATTKAILYLYPGTVIKSGGKVIKVGTKTAKTAAKVTAPTIKAATKQLKKFDKILDDIILRNKANRLKIAKQKRKALKLKSSANKQVAQKAKQDSIKLSTQMKKLSTERNKALKAKREINKIKKLTPVERAQELAKLQGGATFKIITGKAYPVSPKVIPKSKVKEIKVSKPNLRKGKPTAKKRANKKAIKKQSDVTKEFKESGIVFKLKSKKGQVQITKQKKKDINTNLKQQKKQYNNIKQKISIIDKRYTGFKSKIPTTPTAKVRYNNIVTKTQKKTTKLKNNVKTLIKKENSLLKSIRTTGKLSPRVAAVLKLELRAVQDSLRQTKGLLDDINILETKLQNIPNPLKVPIRKPPITTKTPIKTTDKPINKPTSKTPPKKKIVKTPVLKTPKKTIIKKTPKKLRLSLLTSDKAVKNKLGAITYKEGNKVKTLKTGLPYNKAVKLAQKTADQTLIASFSVKAYGKTNTKDLKRGKSAKFKRKIGKNPLVQTFVEKRKYRIDTKGEKNKLKFAKLIKKAIKKK